LELLILGIRTRESLSGFYANCPLAIAARSGIIDSIFRTWLPDDAVMLMPDIADSQGVDALIRSRRTISVFKPEMPPQEILLNALDAAIWAPNHRKTEPWRFTRLGPQTVRQIVELQYRLVAAKKGPDEAEKKRRQWSVVPGWLLVTCLRATDPLQMEEDYAACCCAIQNLSLSLWDQGIGTKWSTGDVTRDPEFAQLAGFDSDIERVVGLIWYGYPAAVPQQSRRPLSEVLRELP